MKENNNEKLFDLSEISDILHNRFSHAELEKKMESGEIKGKKIEDQWYAKKDAIDVFEEELMQKTVFFTELHQIDLTKVLLNGRILDIGGGGEGIIGQLAGEHVIAIDPSERELKGAPGDCLKIIMDAKDLKFLNESFDTVTVFFTMMYIKLLAHEQVFKEIYRVLKPKGELFIWDLNIPKKKIEEEKDAYAVRLEVDLGAKKIESGYGTKWDKGVDMTHYVNLGESVGLKILEKNINGETFFLKFRKD